MTNEDKDFKGDPFHPQEICSFSNSNSLVNSSSPNNLAVIPIDEEDEYIELFEDCNPIDSIENFDSLSRESSDIPMNLKTDKENDNHVTKEIYKGMEFDSLESIDAHYRNYAKQRGFGVRTRTTRKSNDGIAISCYWVCSCSGDHVKNQSEDLRGKEKRKCSSIRQGCDARLSANFKPVKGKWEIGLFHDLHNHTMVSPTSVKYIRHNKSLSNAAKSLVEMFHEEGVPTGLPAYMFGRGEEEFSRKDCWNHNRNLRLKNLDVGDAQAVLNYCVKKQAENPNFYYSIDCENDRLVNFFWVDARSRLAYEYFGSVVTFDTTYKTNKYSMPFAPFVGLNHHGQSILFGCALLQDEQEASFIWLFKTWLQAMHGKAPKAIITDQDHAMGNAIREVFPNTRHRLCLWHIKNKFQERIPSKIYTEDFRLQLKCCLHESYNIEEFEKLWGELMICSGLKDNEWLNKLYEKRNKWVPIYNQTTFFAGMHTTQRSESINSFFDAFVNQNTSLREFVMKYEKALMRRIIEESREDRASRYKMRILKHNLPIEEQAAKFYTRNIFFLLQNELTKAICLRKKCVHKNDSVRKYDVTDPRKPWKKGWEVSINLESGLGSCGCHLFEFKGILCSHMLAIYHFKGNLIPEEYLLHRWSKEANRALKNSSNVNVDEQDSSTLRALHVCREMNHLSIIAENSKEAYEFLAHKLNDLKLEATKILEAAEINGKEKGGDITSGLEAENLQTPRISDPKISKTKGRNKAAPDGRFKSGLEKSLSRKRKRCQLCGELGHYRTTCKKRNEDASLHDLEESEEEEEEEEEET